VNRRIVLFALGLITLAGTGVSVFLFFQDSEGHAQSTQPKAEPAFRIVTYNPTVRVNLTPSPLEKISIKIDGSYRVIAPGSKTVLAYGKKNGLGKTDVSADETMISIGATRLAITQIEIVPEKSPAIWIGKHQYRGTVRIIKQNDGRLLAVNHLPLEYYIASVINSEMPATFPEAAREAQAIVARTYVLAHMKGHPRFDVFATSRSQQYLGYQYKDANGRALAGESRNSRAIAQKTAGMVCTYKGKIFTTYYTAVCGGHTIDGRSVFSDAVPVVKSVSCDWCREADRYQWTTTLKKDEASKAIQSHLKKKGKTIGTIQSIKRVNRSTKSLSYYEVSDGKNTHEIAGTTFRQVLPYGILHSPEFSANFTTTEVTFVGHGHGHGVGLCQWGTRGLGLAGRNAAEILQFYYPKSSIVRLNGSKK
jgi:stage II sporulation protein D